MTSRSSIIWPDAPCCQPKYASIIGCDCSPYGAAILAWARGAEMPPMTDEQKGYFLAIVDDDPRLIRADFEGASDQKIATAVINARPCSTEV